MFQWGQRRLSQFVARPKLVKRYRELGGTAPTILANRSAAGKQEKVARAWRGFGTLACPGFHSPSWAAGWLVQFEDGLTNGGNRFGFAWDRDQDVVVLDWIDAQDACPFLQRSWLPEDLQ